MTNEKRLKPELENKLLDYIDTCKSEPVNFHYELSDNGTVINLIATYITTNNIDDIMEGISNIEKLLNVVFVVIVVVFCIGGIELKVFFSFPWMHSFIKTFLISIFFGDIYFLGNEK